MHEVFSGGAPKAGLGHALHDLRSARALVIDSNLTSRSILRSMLADLGVPGERIKQVGRYNDARGELERTRYDIVLCDAQIDGADSGGQDLLDELRRVGLLPYATVFVMMTNEATYARVAEAAEAALDAEQKKLENGKSTSFQVLSLQRDLVQAQKDNISALTDYNISLINLAWAEGSLLERLKINITTH